MASKTYKALVAEFGLENDYLFKTTFERYEMQISILKNLKKVMKNDGVLVEKEYVKDRKNIYAHPAIGEYNKTATAANQTVATLIKIIKSSGSKELEEKEDELLKALRINT